MLLSMGVSTDNYYYLIIFSLFIGHLLTIFKVFVLEVLLVWAEK